MIDVSIMFAAVFFALYGLACSIECGVALNMLFGDPKKTKRLFTPIWEVTNVFLIFGITAIAILFNNALESLSKALMSTLLVGFIALLVRACVALVIFYIKPEKAPMWIVWLFGFTCYLAPVAFISTSAYGLTGQLFWYSVSGWLIVATAIFGLSATGLLFLNGKSSPRKMLSNEIIFGAWLLILGSFLPLALLHSGNSLQKWPIAGIDVLSIYGLLVAYLVIVGRTNFKLKYYAALLTLCVPILLTLANRPYLVNGKIKLVDGFGAASFAGAFLVGAAIITPLLMLGFWLFIKLLRTPQND